MGYRNNITREGPIYIYLEEWKQISKRDYLCDFSAISHWFIHLFILFYAWFGPWMRLVHRLHLLLFIFMTLIFWERKKTTISPQHNMEEIALHKFIWVFNGPTVAVHKRTHPIWKHRMKQWHMKESATCLTCANFSTLWTRIWIYFFGMVVLCVLHIKQTQAKHIHFCCE